MAKRDATVTGRQEKWFTSVQDGILRDAGKSLDAWVQIARACREPAQRARAKWLKDKHGIGANRAAAIAKLPDATIGPRRAFVGISRKVQFAAIRPVKVDGKPGARLGLAVALERGPRFAAVKKSEVWSDRLQTIVVRAGVKDVDAELKALLKAT